MSVDYVNVSQRLGWLLQRLEAEFAALPNGANITVRSIRRFALQPSPSDEDVLAALHGLTALGILSRQEAHWKLDHAQLGATEGYRQGVRDGVEVIRSRPSKRPVGAALCAALPVGLPTEVERKLRETAVDLRATVLDIIAAARARVVLAAPFWDRETAGEFGALLQRRIAAGVRVDLLGRELRGSGLHTLYSSLGESPNCNVYLWYAPSADKRFHTQTFHFKAAIADDGARAYVGSANFNAAGLRSRMELGVVLDGAAAAQVATFVDLLLLAARRCARRERSPYEP